MMDLLASALTTPAMIYYTPSDSSVKAICMHGARYELSSVWVQGGYPRLWVQVLQWDELPG